MPQRLTLFVLVLLEFTLENRCKGNYFGSDFAISFKNHSLFTVSATDGFCSCNAYKAAGVMFGDAAKSKTSACMEWGVGNVSYPMGLNIAAGTGAIVGRGSVSDYRLALGDGSGRVNHYWNAFGTGTGVHRAVAPGETALWFEMSDGFMFSYAPAASVVAAGQTLTWHNILTLSDSGDITLGASGVAAARNTIYNPTTIFGSLNVTSRVDVSGALFANRGLSLAPGETLTALGGILALNGATIVGSLTFSGSVTFAGPLSSNGVASFNTGLGIAYGYPLSVTGNDLSWVQNRYMAGVWDGSKDLLAFYVPGGYGGVGAANATIRMAVTNAGNVGIGTTNPAARLDVQGSGRFTGALAVGSASTSTSAHLEWGTGNVPYPGDSRIHVGAASMVGRGSWSDYRIAVQDGTARVNHYWNAFQDISAGVSRSVVPSESAYRFSMGGNGGGFMFSYVPGASIGTAGQPLSWQSILTMVTGGDVTLGASGVLGAKNTVYNPTTILGSLNVSSHVDVFGTLFAHGGLSVDPGQTLTVAPGGFLALDRSSITGSVTITGAATFDGPATFDGGITSTGPASFERGLSIPYSQPLAVGGNANWVQNRYMAAVWDGSTDLLLFYVPGPYGGTGAPNATPRLAVTNAGNVGIGTTTPAARLDVQGAGRFTGTVQVGGLELFLGTSDQTSRGNTGQSRALVKESGSRLYVNYANDYLGGTVIDSAASISGALTATNAQTNEWCDCQQISILSTFDPLNSWVTCPRGFFQAGMKSGGCRDEISCIEYLLCCKPCSISSNVRAGSGFVRYDSVSIGTPSP